MTGREGLFYARFCMPTQYLFSASLLLAHYQTIHSIGFRQSFGASSLSPSNRKPPCFSSRFSANLITLSVFPSSKIYGKFWRTFCWWKNRKSYQISGKPAWKTRRFSVWWNKARCSVGVEKNNQIIKGWKYGEIFK